MAFVQHFTSALLLHPHAHVLLPEGVFCGDDTSFAQLPPPTDAEVEARVVSTIGHADSE